MLLLFLLLSVAAGLAITSILREQAGFDRRRAVVALVAVAALSWPVRRFVLRSEVYAHRALEVDIGNRTATRLTPGTSVHLDVLDYGYLAVQAASGRPEDFIPNVAAGLSASGLPTVTEDGLRDARSSGLPWAIVRVTDAPVEAIALENEAWALVDLSER